jgi:hypothetical protein
MLSPGSSGRRTTSRQGIVREKETAHLHGVEVIVARWHLGTRSYRATPARPPVPAHRHFSAGPYRPRTRSTEGGVCSHDGFARSTVAAHGGHGRPPGSAAENAFDRPNRQGPDPATCTRSTKPGLIPLRVRTSSCRCPDSPASHQSAWKATKSSAADQRMGG